MTTSVLLSGSQTALLSSSLPYYSTLPSLIIKMLTVPAWEEKTDSCLETFYLSHSKLWLDFFLFVFFLKATEKVAKWGLSSAFDVLKYYWTHVCLAVCTERGGERERERERERESRQQCSFMEKKESKWEQPQNTFIMNNDRSHRTWLPESLLLSSVKRFFQYNAKLGRGKKIAPSPPPAFVPDV